jgi:mono/diheme cytochrome c family protein
MPVTRDMNKVGAVLAAALAVVTVRGFTAQQESRLQLQFEDYAQLPITGELDGQNTRGQLARVNALLDEPGGQRFFVNDLNGPLYILDKQTRNLTVYLDFNGLAGRPGLFPKFTFERNFATGLTNFAFDPDYARNGIFYTLHMEDPSGAGSPAPKPGAVPGLDLTGYTTTPAVATPTVEGRIDREVVLIEWTDRDRANATFEGTARELLRVQHPLPQHPLGEMTFNPVARAGDPDWRVMYLGAGDSGSGDQKDSRRINPQRLDTLVGKILRIVPDLREHATTTALSENGRYRIPNDNPFTTFEGARKEIWAYGLRNPHRLIWDVDPARPSEPRLLAFHIGLVSWETVVVIRKGANYGWPLREGTEARSLAGMGPIPADDTIPIHITDTLTRGSVTPTYPVLQYPHRPGGGDAIANGFIYRGTLVPLLREKLVFGDITTGRVWYADRADLLAADDGNPDSVAPIHEIDTDLRARVTESYRARGGKGAELPGVAQISGRGRVDLRFAVDLAGELYVLTKPDGMIRKVVGATPATAPAATSSSAPGSSGPASVPAPSPGVTSSSARALKNPVPATAASIAAGKAAYDATCAACHGDRAQGAIRAKLTLSIIEEQNGKQAPDLTDALWDHGSSDGEIFTVLKRGVPTTMMPGFGGALSDENLWSIVNYLRTLEVRK